MKRFCWDIFVGVDQEGDKNEKVLLECLVEVLMEDNNEEILFEKYSQKYRFRTF